MKRILIVDDLDFIVRFQREVINDLNEELNFDIVVDSASNYDEAIDKIDNFNYDALMSDVSLNDDKSGIDIAKYIKEKNPKIKTATLSIFNFEDNRVGDYFDMLLKKPISPEQYKKNLKFLLDIK
jgi:CheY-like chemotaxis protein